MSLPIALYLKAYLGDSKWGEYVRLSLDVLWGIPSIVYGAFGFALMIMLGMRASLLAGIIVLALVELPIMTRAMDEVIRRMPADLEHAALALGSTKFEVALHVVTRQMLPGIITAILLAFGRGIGDAASVLFTAGYTDRIPTSLMRPDSVAAAGGLLPTRLALPRSARARIRRRVDPDHHRIAGQFRLALAFGAVGKIHHQISGHSIAVQPITTANEIMDTHIQVKNLNVILRQTTGLERYQHRDSQKPDHGHHGTLGLRQDHFTENLQPFLRIDREHTITGEVLVDGQNIYDKDVDVTEVRKVRGLAGTASLAIAHVHL
ncbi:MAG: ABC transporter permease subunit [Desulfosudis oleivorans]|nr:ABC transporter permease subunit [Desulfosudis oleivorans]